MEKKTSRKKNARGVSYDDWLMDELKDPELAVAYLNNALKNSLHGDDPLALDLLLLALRNVVQAHGGFSVVAKKAGVGRESLYKSLSEKGNPRFRTIAALAQALNFELKFR
jgi:probable addiction module antidote protein